MINIHPSSNKQKLRKKCLGWPVLRGLREPNIVIFGAIHVDTVVDRDASDEAIDAPGSVVHSVGGSAYNIATNIAIHNRHDLVPAVYTILGSNTLLAKPILKKLGASGVSRKYVRRTAKFAGSPVALGGFVAIRDRKTRDIIKAGTQTPIEDFDLFGDAKERDCIDRCMQGTKVIVADTNLNEDTLEALSRICKERELPLVVVVSSERKAHKYSSLNDVADWSCAALGLKPSHLGEIMRRAGWSESSIAEIFGGITNLDTEQITALCDLVKSDCVIIVERDYYAIVGRYQQHVIIIHPPESVSRSQRRGNRTGVTDAVLAAFVDFASSELDRFQGKLILKELTEDTVLPLNKKVNLYVSDVVKRRGATRGSELKYSEEEFGTVWGTVKRYFSEYRDIVWLSVIPFLVFIWNNFVGG